MISTPEVHRQMFHLVLGIVLVSLIHLEILQPLTLFLIILVGIMLSFLSKRVDIPFVSWFLDHFERPEQRKNFPGRGVIFYFIGTLLVMKLFSRNIALASIMVLALGDSLSHLVGAEFGQLRNIFNGKSRKLLEGTLAGILAGFIGAVIFVPIPEAFLGSMGAMIAEVIQIDFNEKTVDDNLIVPLAAGTIMLLVGKFI